MRFFLKSRLLILILGLLLVGWAGWLVWQAIRPPSTRYWSTELSRAKTAQSLNQLLLAARCMNKAVVEAKRFGPNDMRLADTLIAQGELWLETIWMYHNYHALIFYWSPKGVVDYSTALAEKQYANHLTLDQVKDNYHQALLIYEKVYANNPSRLIDVYTTFIRRFKEMNDNKEMLGIANRTLALQEEIDGTDSIKLLPHLATLEKIYLALRDAGTAFSFRIRRYSILRRAYTIKDARTQRAYQDCYSNAIQIGFYGEAAQLAKEHLNDLSFAPYDKRLIVPLSQYANALALAGRFNEAEAVFQRGMKICDHAFPKRFYDYPDGSFFIMPDDMHRLYGDYYRFLLQTKQNALADRVLRILTD